MSSSGFYSYVHMVGEYTSVWTHTRQHEETKILKQCNNKPMHKACIWVNLLLLRIKMCCISKN